MSDDDTRKRAFELYRPPFRFAYGYVFDAENNTVADQAGKGAALRIRGWGRIGYMPDAERLQDAVGELIAQAITEFWVRCTDSVPIPMLIFCPVCHCQHIDAPETDEQYGRRVAEMERPVERWTNPPHTSHLCANCGEVFRLADVPTVGVASIETKGSRDTWSL